MVDAREDDLLPAREAGGRPREIVAETVAKGRSIERLLYRDPARAEAASTGRDPVLPQAAARRPRRSNGQIDPRSIDDYIADRRLRGAREGALQDEAGEVIEEVNKAGLRGRGGGGFPTGLQVGDPRASAARTSRST